MNSIFELSDDLETIHLDKKEMKLLEDHLNVLYKNKVDVLRMTINNQGIYMEATENHPVYHKSGVTKDLEVSEEVTLGVNSRYLHDALMMIRMLGLEEVTIHAKDQSRHPISLISKNLHYIIMPVILTA